MTVFQCISFPPKENVHHHHRINSFHLLETKFQREATKTRDDQPSVSFFSLLTLLKKHREPDEQRVNDFAKSVVFFPTDEDDDDEDRVPGKGRPLEI